MPPATPVPIPTDTAPVFFVGIDLALCSKHVAAVLDASGRTVGKNLYFGHGFDEHYRLLQQVTDRLPAHARIIWAAETSGGVWLPSAAFFAAQAQTFVLQKATKVADLRRYQHRHLKTDPVDARAIADCARLDYQRGLPLHPPSDPKLQAQRALGRRIEQLHQDLGGAKNRVISLLCHTLLPDLATTRHDWCSSSMLKVLHACADLPTIIRRSENEFIASARGPRKGGSRSSRPALSVLYRGVDESLRIYGPRPEWWNSYAVLLREAIQTIWDIEARIAGLEQELAALLEPYCPPQTAAAGLSVPGVGSHVLQQTQAFFGPPDRWPRFESLKQYAGLVPVLEASGTTEASFVMSKLGEPIIRKLVYNMGNTARLVDAEFAACYYDQMVNRGKRHTGACIAAGLDVLNALRAVLRDGRPFEHRDPHTGQPISREHSRHLATTVYAVPDDVRNQRRKRKHSAATTAAGEMKDVPKALPEPHRSRVSALC